LPGVTLTSKIYVEQVDYIRAIASVAVALFHLGGKVLPVSRFGWLGVQMFFLLSGFIICWSMPANYSWNSVKTFLLKRLIRIEPPYVISIILLILVRYLLIDKFEPDWKNVVLHLGYLNSFFNKPYLNPVYWTLGIEFQFYLLIAFIFPLINTKYGVLLLIAIAIIPLITNIPSVGLFGFFTEFGIGICLFLIKTNFLSLKYLLTMFTLIILCFLINGSLQASATLIALILLILPLRTNLITRFFSKISFSLYLTHDIIGSTYVVHIGALLPKTVWWKAFEFSSGILLSVIFAYCFYLLVERPFYLYAKKIGYPRTIE
jgi:peptidoglycan/LPS O-acetylase OafA/YrhL